MKGPPDFNRLARLYRWMEFFSFGPWLWLTRRTFLGDLAASRRALVLGDGDGRFTGSLLRSNSAVHVDAVDASSAMLQLLVGRAGPSADRVRVYLADIRDWQPPAPIVEPPYDMIVTHFLLDCLSSVEIKSLTVKLRSAVSPGALWIVSEFAVPPGWFGRIIAFPLVSGLYISFGWLTGLEVRSLPEHAAALQEAGFTLLDHRSRLGGLLIAEKWAASSCDYPQTPTLTLL
jgi:hypothetical protein